MPYGATIRVIVYPTVALRPKHGAPPVIICMFPRCPIVWFGLFPQTSSSLDVRKSSAVSEHDCALACCNFGKSTGKFPLPVRYIHWRRRNIVMFICLTFPLGPERIMIIPRVISIFVEDSFTFDFRERDRLSSNTSRAHCLTNAGRVFRASDIAVLDSTLETFMNSIGELPCVELRIFGVAPGTRLVKWVTPPTGTISVTKLISDLNTICLDGPRLLDHTAIVANQAKGATMEVHRLESKL